MMKSIPFKILRLYNKKFEKKLPVTEEDLKFAERVVGSKLRLNFLLRKMAGDDLLFYRSSLSGGSPAQFEISEAGADFLKKVEMIQNWRKEFQPI